VGDAAGDAVGDAAVDGSITYVVEHCPRGVAQP